jgi:hypothetical protein
MLSVYSRLFLVAHADDGKDKDDEAKNSGAERLAEHQAARDNCEKGEKVETTAWTASING